MERRERDVTNVLEVARTTSSSIDLDKQDEKSMIDVTFRMKENEMFADVKVFSFNLILSVDFLMKLSSFLQPSTSDEGDESQIVLNSADFALEQQSSSARENEIRRRRSSFNRQQSQEQEVAAAKKAVFAIHIEEYDIILVEKMDDINCLALILNVSSMLKLIDGL
jgi:vacuolar protein sorting-associated protein 13A/C